MNTTPTDRIKSLKCKTLEAKRFLSLDQAKIITEVYRENDDKPVSVKRAMALAASLLHMPIAIDPEELIVGNRTPDIRAGVVFPEAGISWLSKEIDHLPSRQQDPFYVKEEDVLYFRQYIEPFWKGKTMEDEIYRNLGDHAGDIEKVVKINQKDHAQGHVCPKVSDWLEYGPSGLAEAAKAKKPEAEDFKQEFYDSLLITLDASYRFIERYGLLASEMKKDQKDPAIVKNLEEISEICYRLSTGTPSTFREALQSVWFLFVILQMESNASSFSPGRMDQYLYKYYRSDISCGKTDPVKALELIDALYLKFNHIVYMRNSHSARYFAGFPIGFNLTIGGRAQNGEDAVNELSYLFLKAQDHVRLPQPNLTARMHKGVSEEFLDECTRVIGIGTGMPQIVNDESIIPALEHAGISTPDAIDYSLVGCVELSTNGNYLGWSDAAMFNMVKVMELTLNDGKCMITGKQLGPATGTLSDYITFEDLEEAFRSQVDYFVETMILSCEIVEKCHQQYLPSPFLSSVIDDCIVAGKDVTAGGAKYNLSGIQAIQVANVADSIAVIRKLVFEENGIEKSKFLKALRNNFKDDEVLRQKCINQVPKYGNDIEWVDNIGARWISYFSEQLKRYRNSRGGAYQMGLYTVSAHVPMGVNVAATPDGRLAGTPLADGGLSPMYGRDREGPTAVLRSVARIPSSLAGNGTLLNMKFLPSFFSNEEDRRKFNSLIRSFIRMPIHHVQFNVVTNDELAKAKADPVSYRDLTVRVAGYTAYFTELAGDLQDEIINRTSHGDG